MTQAQEQFCREVEKSGAIVFWGCLENMSIDAIDKLIELDKIMLGLE